jgi:hypothetical protein
MRISELLEKLINAGLVPSDPHKAWEVFSEAVYTLDLQDQANFADAATELFESHASLLWSELGGEGSPNVDRPSVAIARSTKPEPRQVSNAPVTVDEPDVDFLIPPDVELAIVEKAQLFAAQVCRIYHTHAVDAARAGIAEVNASIMDSLGGA